MFPFGCLPLGSDPNLDERGPDTMNRLLLHGARYHDRDSLFSTPGGDCPDWRADRHSIRIALGMQEIFDVGPGDVVALWMPLSAEWAMVERGVWGLGAASLPLPYDGSFSEISGALERHRPKILFAPSDGLVSEMRLPDSVRAVCTLTEPLDGLGLGDLLERGGVLDTPERASRFRAVARQIPADALASVEPDPLLDLSHALWVRSVERFLTQNPPEPGGRRVVRGDRPDVAARIALYAGWADGLSTVVLER